MDDREQRMIASQLADLGMARREEIELFDPRSSYDNRDIEAVRAREERRRGMIKDPALQAWTDPGSFQADPRFMAQAALTGGQLHRDALRQSLQPSTPRFSSAENRSLQNGSLQTPHHQHHAFQVQKHPVPRSSPVTGRTPTARQRALSPTRWGTQRFIRGQRVDDNSHTSFEALLAPRGGDAQLEPAITRAEVIAPQHPVISVPSRNTSQASRRKARRRLRQTSSQTSNTRSESDEQLNEERRHTAHLLVELALEAHSEEAHEYLAQHSEHVPYFQVASRVIQHVRTRPAILNAVYYRDGTIWERSLFEAATARITPSRADSVTQQVDQDVPTLADPSPTSSMTLTDSEAIDEMTTQISQLSLVIADGDENGVELEDEDDESYWLRMTEDL